MTLLEADGEGGLWVLSLDGEGGIWVLIRNDHGGEHSGCRHLNAAGEVLYCNAGSSGFLETAVISDGAGGLRATAGSFGHEQ